jgi:CRISPR-associated protein Csx10
MNHCRYLPYTLTLSSPAIITTLGGDPNSSSSLSYIPGSAVRGAVAKALGDPTGDDARQQEFHDLVLGGKARYLHAYPSADGRRALPVPVSLRRKKDGCESDKTVSAVDLAAYAGDASLHEELSECWPDEQLAPLDAGFLTLGAAQLTQVQPQMSARIHHQRHRGKGRAWKDPQGASHGAIFAFESLDSGQTFQGMIQVRGETEEENQHIEERLQELLSGPILVGRSRRAGYGGLATVQWGDVRRREAEGTGTEGLRPVNRDIAPGDPFRLMLTSACIFRNPGTGQIDPTALAVRLEGLLGDRAELVRRRWSFEPVGAFNRKWRLEVPQVLAVAAGSVFVLGAKQGIALADLLRIENEGLGERKEEGFGRLLFLDPPLRTISLPKADERVAKTPPASQPPALVTSIERRILEAQLQRKIEQAAAESVRSTKNLPSNSLIGRLRTPLRGKPEDAIRTLTAWLRSDNEAERLKRPAMEQLERCRMDGGRDLAKWILDMIDAETVLQRLKVNVLAQQCHIVSEESARRTLEGKSQELSVKLIDALLATMAVRNKTQEVGDER